MTSQQRRQYFTAYQQIWWSLCQYERHPHGGIMSSEQASGSPYNSGSIETCCKHELRDELRGLLLHWLTCFPFLSVFVFFNVCARVPTLAVSPHYFLSPHRTLSFSLLSHYIYATPLTPYGYIHACARAHAHENANICKYTHART